MEIAKKYIKHPVVIGCLSFMLSFSILYFQMEEPDGENKKDIIEEKNKQIMINLIISLLIGVLTWFAIASYYDINNIIPISDINQQDDIVNISSTATINDNRLLDIPQHELVQNGKIDNNIINSGIENSGIENNDEINKLNMLLSQGPAVSETMRGNVFYNLKKDDFKTNELERLLEVRNL